VESGLQQKGSKNGLTAQQQQVKHVADALLQWPLNVAEVPTYQDPTIVRHAIRALRCCFPNVWNFADAYRGTYFRRTHSFTHQ
jgi:hypothetical protein